MCDSVSLRRRFFFLVSEIAGGGLCRAAQVLDIADYDYAHARGGLGKYIAFELAAFYAYQYTDGKNRLTLIVEDQPDA